jgi:hypothetical protein
MKKFMLLMLASVLMVLAAPVYSDSVIEVYECEQDDDTTDERVEEMVEEWLKAARGMKGGENLEVYINFPISAGNIGETDITMVLVAPSFAEWGTFQDNYDGSAADDIDQKYRDDVDCPSSTLWESMKVEIE